MESVRQWLQLVGLRRPAPATSWTVKPPPERAPPTPLSSSEAFWLPVVFVAATIALGWGCLSGDLTDREAEVVGYADAGPTRFSSAISRLPPTYRDEAAKAMSFLSLVGSAVSVGLYARRFGPAALWISAAAFAAAPMALWQAGCATDDALTLFLAVVGVWLVRGAPIWRRLAGGAALLAAYLTFVDPVLRGGAWTVHERWWAPPAFVLTFGAPYLSLLIAAPMARWPTTWRGARTTVMRFALGVVAAALMAGVLPGRAPVCGLAAAWCSAVVVGALAELYRASESHPNLQRRLTAALRIAGYAAPAAIVLWSIYRIETVYQYMERTQAAFLAALLLIALGPSLLRRGQPTVWLPMVLAALVGKGLWVHVIRAERDHRVSPRPYATAVAARTPANAVVWTDLPLGPAYRYYLQREIRTTERADYAETGVLLRPASDKPPAGDWRIAARMYASPFGPLELAVPQPLKTATTQESAVR